MDAQEHEREATGAIISLNEDRGFGFIRIEGNPQHVFLHATACTNKDFKMLKKGSQVAFDIQQGEKGPRAVNCVRI